MARATGKRLIHRDAVEAAGASLLVRFLTPWSSFLATRSIALAPSLDLATRTALYDLFAKGDPGLPTDLRQELVDLDEMATIAGHDQLLALVAERNAEPLPRALTPVDLALTARLERHDLFKAARVRVEHAGVARYAAFEPRARARFDGHRDGARVERMARTLGAWFESKNRTAYCEVLVVECDAEILFEVTHGEPPRAHGLLDDNLARRVERLVMTRRDHLVVHRGSGPAPAIATDARSVSKK